MNDSCARNGLDEPDCPGIGLAAKQVSQGHHLSAGRNREKKTVPRGPPRTAIRGVRDGEEHNPSQSFVASRIGKLLTRRLFSYSNPRLFIAKRPAVDSRRLVAQRHGPARKASVHFCRALTAEPMDELRRHCPPARRCIFARAAPATRFAILEPTPAGTNAHSACVLLETLLSSFNLIMSFGRPDCSAADAPHGVKNR